MLPKPVNKGRGWRGYKPPTATLEDVLGINLPKGPEGRSRVAHAVAAMIQLDAPHLLPPYGTALPTAAGDEWRAIRCLKWLVHTATPMWLHMWVSRQAPYRSTDICLALKEAEQEDAPLATLGATFGVLDWLMTVDSPVQPTAYALHKIQRVGFRSVYSGVKSGSNDKATSVALLSMRLLAKAIPQTDTADSDVLLTESTQSSVLVLLDELLEERKADAESTTT